MINWRIGGFELPDNRCGAHGLSFGSLDNSTVMVSLFPGPIVSLFLPTFPDSTQTIFKYSSSPKSAMALDLAIQGFHTTVAFEPSFFTRITRPRVLSRISTSLVV